MPFGLGFFAAAGAGGAAADAFELIQTTTLTNDTTQTFTISNIPQTYKNLQIRYSVKNTPFTGAGDLLLRLNGITSNIYSYHGILGRNSASDTFNTGTNSILAPSGTIGTTPANLFVPAIIEIVDYSNSSRKPVIRLLSGRPDSSDFVVYVIGGFANSTGAITEFSIGLVTSNPQSYLASNTSISLYGLRG